MPHLEKTCFFAYAKTKAQISCAVTAQLISLCFHYVNSTIHLLPKYEMSSLLPSSVAVQPGLCRTWPENWKTGFVVTLCKHYIQVLNTGT